ncbi:MAG: hypothetical protein P1U89_00155 [Verrucomicrobiales bacterium]|nr:hypothetical protein [Verrucomicrobiales bacterium]
MPKPFLTTLILIGSGLVSLLTPHTGKAQTFSEFRKKYIAAEAFKDTGIKGIDPANIKSIFYQILKDVVHDEPDIADDLVLQTHRLILQNIDERGAFKPMKNGTTYISGFISYYEDVIESLDCIGLMVRTYRNDLKGEIPFNGIGNNARQFALFSHFLSRGGNYQPTSAMDLILRDLRTVCGEGQSIFLAPYFFDFAYHLRPAQRNEIAAWAIEKSGDPDLTISGFGEAIHLGLAMFERAEGTPIASTRLLRANRLDSRLIEILQNPILSPAWRVGFANLIGRNFREEITPPVRLEIGRTLTLAFQDKASVSGTAFKYAIAAFLRGSDQDQAWRNQGTELIAAWEKRISKSLKPVSSRLDPRSDFILPMTELICRVGTKSQISTHFQRFSFDDLVYPGIWIHLIRAGEFSLANQARIKQANVTEYSPDHLDVDAGYDARLEKAIPDYLKTIPGKNDRLLAELILSATPNSPIFSRAESNLQTRLDAYVKKHPELPEWTGEQQVRAFEIFSLSQKNRTIKEWLETNQIGLETRIEQEEPRVRPYWAGRIEMHGAACELESGLSFPIELWWGRAVKDDNQTISRRRGDLCRAILMMTDERIINSCQENDPERLRNYLSISRSILETVPEYVYRTYVRQFALRALTAHALCNRADEWTQWWDSLEAVRKRHLTTILTHSSELIPTVDELLNPKNLDPEKAFSSPGQRRQVMSDILRAEWIDEGYHGYSNLANAAAVRLLTDRDLYDIAENIARTSPRKGSAWREFLGILADQGQQEEALRLIEEELENLDPTLSIVTALKVEKLLLLQSLKREEEAEEYLAEFETTSFDLPREYQAIVRNLGKR